MKTLTVQEAREQIKAHDLWIWRQRNWNLKIEPNGINTVSDHDEDYVLDALFDVPNR